MSWLNRATLLLNPMSVSFTSNWDMLLLAGEKVNPLHPDSVIRVKDANNRSRKYPNLSLLIFGRSSRFL